MSDIKLFQVHNSHVVELKGKSVDIEKSLQSVIEKNLETFFKIRFIASEYSTGKKHGGRIDTLGIDENGSPVIIEYKRAINENVINQGLFYLNWLLNQRGEVTLLVRDKFGKNVSDSIEWENARLLCIAGDFTKFDISAVEEINRNIELIRYKRFGENLILFELVNVISSDSSSSQKPSGNRGRGKTVLELYEKMPQALKDSYESIKHFIQNLGDDIQEKQTKIYIAYKRIANFACFEFHPGAEEILIFLKVDPTTIELEEGFTRDVSNIGHFGTGDLEVRVTNKTNLERVYELIKMSYEMS